MKFTLGWLKDHLDTSASLADISRTLTMAGLEVESIADTSESLKAFTVAKILSASKHPEADKLQVCKVQSDAGELQIVCGAANARAELYVALAREGAHIPGNGMVIKKTKIRGVESNGMLCSASELGIEGDADGIIELPEAPIGASVADVLGLNDPVIEIAVTPNRADALGVRGIARDLAAAGLGILKPLPPTQPSTLTRIEPGEGLSPITVKIETPACRQFIGATIKGVKNGPSPDWMKKRLSAVGLRPISALVDITNYITIDLGRPLHVYDAKKLKGNLTVRDAKAGEKLKALNDKEYILAPGMCVIADESGPVALGGVIGGEATGCDEQATDVFLEVALFDPMSVARTGRALQIDSDARYRFERGVDVAFVETGAKLALKLIQELCLGTASELTVSGKTPEWKHSITLEASCATALSGIHLHENAIEKILTSLGFACEANYGSWNVTPPSWRADVEGEADLIEEILRIHGYDHIPLTPLPKLSGISKPILSPAQKRAHLARRVLAARGYMESCTWSFMPEAQAKLFGGNNPKLKLLNPISADLDTMRPSLLPNLLDAAKRNTFRGAKDIYLFEAGLQFSDITPDGQRLAVSGVSCGTGPWYEHDGELMKRHICPASAFDAKADALALLAALGVNKADIATQTPPWYHPGRSGALTLGGKIVMGYFGELHPAIAQSYDLEGPVAVFELFPDALPLPRAKSKARPMLKVSDFQTVERDFAFIVDAKVSAADIIKTVARADKSLITGVELFDVYTGKGVDAGKKSVAISVTLQAPDRTLSDAEIKTVSDAVITAAASFGGQIRQ